MSLLEFSDVEYSYYFGTADEVRAVRGVSFCVEEGEFVALVGHNGCGKSTIARLINGLLLPDEGSVVVDGLDTRQKKHLFDIRRTASVVFQNPDNQMVATIIEDDIAFGPENLGLAPELIRERVDWALGSVGMLEYKNGTPYKLSGGQKQRIAIAGVLAIKSRIMVLDESTSMLDPIGRQEVIEVIRKLNKEEKMTVILITHFMEEALLADRIIVMDKGKILTSGTSKIFDEPELLRSVGLDIPPVSRVAQRLRERGVNIPSGTTTSAQLIQALANIKKNVTDSK